MHAALGVHSVCVFASARVTVDAPTRFSGFVLRSDCIFFLRAAAELSPSVSLFMVPFFFCCLDGSPCLSARASSPLVQQKGEQKDYYANERNYIHWLHMAVTLGPLMPSLLPFPSLAPDIGATRHALTCAARQTVYAWK